MCDKKRILWKLYSLLRLLFFKDMSYGQSILNIQLNVFSFYEKEKFCNLVLYFIKHFSELLFYNAEMIFYVA